MNKLLVSTVIEAIYLIFMYNYFKTTYTFHNPIEMLLNKKVFSDFFKHPMNNSVYENKICPLGHITSKLLVVWLFLRLWLVKYDKTRTKLANSVIFGLFFILSLLMNLNAFIYLIPIFIYEYLR